jgi:hypothetical protein
VFGINRHKRKILTVILSISLAVTFSSCQFFKKRFCLGEYSLKAAIEWARADSTRVADSLNRVIIYSHVILDTPKRELNNVKRDIQNISNNGRSYDIITGSFTSRENAEKVAEEYKNMGFNTYIIISSLKSGAIIELVSVKSLSDFNDALLFLQDFKGKYDPGAWIYVTK